MGRAHTSSQILIYVLYTGDWLASRHCRFNPTANKPQHHLVGGWVGPRTSTDKETKNISCQTVNRTSKLRSQTRSTVTALTEQSTLLLSLNHYSHLTLFIYIPWSFSFIVFLWGSIRWGKSDYSSDHQLAKMTYAPRSYIWEARVRREFTVAWNVSLQHWGMIIGRKRPKCF
jgi:hypothetical protein